MYILFPTTGFTVNKRVSVRALCRKVESLNMVTTLCAWVSWF